MSSQWNFQSYFYILSIAKWLRLESRMYIVLIRGMTFFSGTSSSLSSFSPSHSRSTIFFSNALRERSVKPRDYLALEFKFPSYLCILIKYFCACDRIYAPLLVLINSYTLRQSLPYSRIPCKNLSCSSSVHLPWPGTPDSIIDYGVVLI